MKTVAVGFFYTEKSKNSSMSKLGVIKVPVIGKLHPILYLDSSSFHVANTLSAMIFNYPKISRGITIPVR
jgi:hypothetical protein